MHGNQHSLLRTSGFFSNMHRVLGSLVPPTPGPHSLVKDGFVLAVRRWHRNGLGRSSLCRPLHRPRASVYLEDRT